MSTNPTIELIRRLTDIKGISPDILLAVVEAATEAAEALADAEVTRRLELADLHVRADARRSVPSHAPVERKARKPRAAKVPAMESSGS